MLRLNLDHTSITRDEFINQMQERNIGCSVHFIPVHLLSYYREKYRYQPEQFPVALREYQRIVSLPLSTRMTDNDVKDVIDAVIGILQENRFTKPITTGRTVPADVISA